jgi:hypothetical protein
LLAIRQNDNAWVEQKNWTQARQFVGYDRLAEPAQAERLKACGQADSAQIARLEKLLAMLNPFALKRCIEKKLRRVLRGSAGSRLGARGGRRRARDFRAHSAAVAANKKRPVSRALSNFRSFSRFFSASAAPHGRA